MTVTARFDPAGPLRGDYTPPPDKSISHRAALFGAMCDEPVPVRNFLDSDDTRSTVNAVMTLGAGVEEEGERWRSQLNSLAAAIHSWTGNHAGIAEISERDLARLRRERPPVIENVDTDGITLIGDEPSSLFRRRR